MTEPLTFGSLFDGIYGFGLGFERAGLSCLWRSEIDPHCNALMEQRRPNIENLGDVRNVTRQNARTVDVICGGFPCQDLSVAGKRAGLAGERSGLWFQFHRIVDETRPSIVVIENVPGLLSSNNGRDFAVILRGLVVCGYGIAWRILDARYFGVAQRRRRVFVVASLGNGRAAEILFESEGVSRDFAARGEAGEGIAEDSFCVARSTGAGFYSQDDKASVRAETGGTTFDIVAWNWQSGGDVWHDFNARPMLHSGQVPAVGVRRLTPIECERLQGFPDGWTDGFADSVRYRMLGNAVCVPVAEWIAKRINAPRGANEEIE